MTAHNLHSGLHTFFRDSTSVQMKKTGYHASDFHDWLVSSFQLSHMQALHTDVHIPHNFHASPENSHGQLASPVTCRAAGHCLAVVPRFSTSVLYIDLHPYHEPLMESAGTICG
jgi:hypothetical protein